MEWSQFIWVAFVDRSILNRALEDQKSEIFCYIKQFENVCIFYCDYHYY